MRTIIMKAIGIGSSRRLTRCYSSLGDGMPPTSTTIPPQITPAKLFNALHVFECPDQSGIMAKISERIASRGGNILNVDLFVGRHSRVFYSRSEFVYDPMQWSREVIDEDFLKLAKMFNANKSIVRVPEIDPKFKIAVLASRQDHCLVDLLHGWQEGKLPVNITCVISNHKREPNTHVIRFLERHGIPYHYLPTGKEYKREEEILSLVGDTDFLVLARYMQVLSSKFLGTYGKDIINIHHGLLPSFKGGNTFKQAYDAGVKLIGATSHFITEELDAGPIIEQMMAFLTRRVAIGAEYLHPFKIPAMFARWNSSGSSAQRDIFESLSTPKTEPMPQQVPTQKFKGHHMLSPFTAGWQSKDVHPLIIDRSEGVFVYDNNGKKYLDALAGLWCNALGGHEPRLVAAATAQLNKLPFYHSFWNRTSQPALDLAKGVLELFTPKEMGKVFFTNSGSESNDTQVKLVWYYNNALGRPKKKKIIAQQKAYHGSTLISASLSGLTNLHQSFDLPVPFVLHTDCPHYWRYHVPGETEKEFATRLADNLEKLILKEGPETIAAFIAEPVMGAGGVILPPDTYFEKVQAVVKKYNILFIADEVICGFGRLGTMFGCEKYNIKPDLVSIAKALSSAYMPIAAVLVSQEVADVILSESNKYGSFGHGFTNSGHPVACAVALEALNIYKERNIIEHVQSVAPILQDGMKSLTESPIVGEIRGTGLVVGVEFTENKSPEASFPPEWAIGAYAANQCLQRGMLVRVAGDSIMMSPPLIITPNEIQQIINIFQEASKSTEERVNYLKRQNDK